MKTSFKVKKIWEYQSISEYFTDFYHSNKTRRKEFSYRYISKSLKWPPSFFSDVCSGRKKLPIARGLEFAKWAKLSNLEIENLLLLILADNQNKDIRDQVTKIRLTSHVSYHPDRGERVKNYDFNLKVIAVYHIIHWARGNISKAEIQKNLPLFPNITSREIDDAILSLVKDGFLKPANTGFEISGKILERNSFGDHLPTEDWSIFDEFSKLLPEFIKVTYFPFTANHTFVELPFESRKEIFERFMAFKNWVLKLSEETKASVKKRQEETVVFHFGLDLHPIHNAGDLMRKIKN